MKWCKTTRLEYEGELQEIFEGHSAIGAKAASYSTLQNNCTTSNQEFDPRLLASTEQTQEENGEASRSYLIELTMNLRDHSVKKERHLRQQVMTILILGHNVKRSSSARMSLLKKDLKIISRQMKHHFPSLRAANRRV